MFELPDITLLLLALLTVLVIFMALRLYVPKKYTALYSFFLGVLVAVITIKSFHYYLEAQVIIQRNVSISLDPCMNDNCELVSDLCGFNKDTVWHFKPENGTHVLVFPKDHLSRMILPPGPYIESEIKKPDNSHPNNHICQFI